jgi:hypothetical protein
LNWGGLDEVVCCLIDVFRVEVIRCGGEVRFSLFTFYDMIDEINDRSFARCLIPDIPTMRELGIQLDGGETNGAAERGREGKLTRWTTCRVTTIVIVL